MSGVKPLGFDEAELNAKFEKISKRFWNKGKDMGNRIYVHLDDDGKLQFKEKHIFNRISLFFKGDEEKERYSLAKDGMLRKRLLELKENPGTCEKYGPVVDTIFTIYKLDHEYRDLLKRVEEGGGATPKLETVFQAYDALRRLPPSIHKRKVDSMKGKMEGFIRRCSNYYPNLIDPMKEKYPASYYDIFPLQKRSDLKLSYVEQDITRISELFEHLYAMVDGGVTIGSELIEDILKTFRALIPKILDEDVEPREDALIDLSDILYGCERLMSQEGGKTLDVTLCAIRDAIGQCFNDLIQSNDSFVLQETLGNLHDKDLDHLDGLEDKKAKVQEKLKTVLEDETKRVRQAIVDLNPQWRSMYTHERKSYEALIQDERISNDIRDVYRRMWTSLEYDKKESLASLNRLLEVEKYNEEVRECLSKVGEDIKLIPELLKLLPDGVGGKVTMDSKLIEEISETFRELIPKVLDKDIERRDALAYLADMLHFCERLKSQQGEEVPESLLGAIRGAIDACFKELIQSGRIPQLRDTLGILHDKGLEHLDGLEDKKAKVREELKTVLERDMKLVQDMIADWRPRWGILYDDVQESYMALIQAERIPKDIRDEYQNMLNKFESDTKGSLQKGVCDALNKIAGDPSGNQAYDKIYLFVSSGRIVMEDLPYTDLVSTHQRVLQDIDFAKESEELNAIAQDIRNARKRTTAPTDGPVLEIDLMYWRLHQLGLLDALEERLNRIV